MTVTLHETTARSRPAILTTAIVRTVRRVLAPAVIALCALAISPVPGTATVIDSFTDPLPVNPHLPASGARVLFLGSLCDGAACPPATVVAGPEFSDHVEQAGLTGVLGSNRELTFGTYFEPNPGASGVLTIDPPDGGTLSWNGTDNPALAVVLKYGDVKQPLNHDLTADGSDRLEIEILSAPVSPFGVGHVAVQLGPENAHTIGAPHAGSSVILYGPGLIVIPFTELGDRLDEFEHDVAFMRFEIRGSGIQVGEIRTVSAPTPARTSSWGRIKSDYRR